MGGNFNLKNPFAYRPLHYDVVWPTDQDLELCSKLCYSYQS